MQGGSWDAGCGNLEGQAEETGFPLQSEGWGLFRQDSELIKSLLELG